MKISGLENINFLSKIQKTTMMHKISVAYSTKVSRVEESLIEETPAVKVSISSEGKQSYRNSLVDKNETYDSVMNRRSELLLGDKPMSRIYMFKITFFGGEKTVEDIASDLFKTYTSMYDEIVKGYKTGQGVNYIQDSESENGYRQMTMTEDLNSLEKALKGAINGLEEQIKRIPDDIKALKAVNESRIKFAKHFGEQDDRVEKGVEAILRMESIVIPENISGKMMAAVKTFVDQYSKQETINLENMLKNINMFNTDSKPVRP